MDRVVFGARVAAAVLVSMGFMLSRDAGQLAARPPIERAGYSVAAVDLHVHSFPGDGVLPPWDIAVEARRRRLDAVALTNHNSTHSWRLAQLLAPITGRAGALLMPGRELTSAGYHLAIVGTTQAIAWRQPASAAAAAAHAAGGVAIAAHPARRNRAAFDDAALVALDGVERAPTLIHANDQLDEELTAFYERARRVHPSIAAIGSTDFHRFAPIGMGRTYVLTSAPGQAGILDAIRAGRTVACDGLGRAYGPAKLVVLVQSDCRSDATMPPDGQTGAARVGTWMVWIGMVALVLLGASSLHPR
ncbi:MAG: CehA/McbA family metallohydrolase [Vicinamibacterales bacterium]